ncbi:MAG: RimK family alpha-L-glutamate ligase [bacterium]
MKIGIVGGGEGWHRRQLEAALIKRGVTVLHYPITQLTARIDTGNLEVAVGDKILQDCTALVVRTIPGGSLEQIILRMDILRRLKEQGLSVYNSPTVIEKAVDKYYTSSVLAAAGIPTPPTVVTEDYQQALAAFEELGRDVVVKPLFGSLGKGMVRVSDPDVAQRVFRALDLGGYVFYLQQYVPHDNWDIRAFVLGKKVIAAMTRAGCSWKTNLAQGAEATWRILSSEEKELALKAAGCLGADYAGVDLLWSQKGQLFVLEVNGIPGWQGLQSVCSVDIAGALADYVVERS